MIDLLGRESSQLEVHEGWIARLHRGIFKGYSDSELIMLEFLIDGDYSRLPLREMHEDRTLVERLRRELYAELPKSKVGDMEWWLSNDFVFSISLERRVMENFMAMARECLPVPLAYFSGVILPKTRIITRGLMRGQLPEYSQSIDEVISILRDTLGFSDIPIHEMSKTVVGVAFPGARIITKQTPGIITSKEADRVRVRNFVEEVLRINPSEAPRLVGYATFCEHGLGGFLWSRYRNSPSAAIVDAYPEMRVDQFRKRPNGYWVGEEGKRRAIDAIRWMVEEKMRIGVEEIPTRVNSATFLEHGLNTPLDLLFCASPYEGINAAYPGRFFPWEMEVTPMNYFAGREDRQLEAIKWLVEGKLGYAIPSLSSKEIWEQRIARKITQHTIYENGLAGLLVQFGKRPELMLRFAYPDKWYDWSFQRHGMWQGIDGRERAARAVRWLFEEKLGVSVSEIPEYATWSTFIREGFHGLITAKSLGFNSSPYAAVSNAYPGRFRREEFRYSYAQMK
jgi:hypothetical protein